MGFSSPTDASTNSLSNPSSADSADPADPSDSAASKAIVAGHGQFAEGLISGVAQITGLGERFIAFSNLGMGKEAIESELRLLVLRDRAQVIFTDLPGGSATLAARRLATEFPELTIVTGANLATLIDFVFHDGTMLSRDAARHAADKGRRALMVTPDV